MSIVKTRPHPTFKGPVMTCTTIVRKMTGQKTGRYCVEVIMCLPSFLRALSNDTQQTLTNRTVIIHSATLREACPYYMNAAVGATDRVRTMCANCGCRMPWHLKCIRLIATMYTRKCKTLWGRAATITRLHMTRLSFTLKS